MKKSSKGAAAAATAGLLLLGGAGSLAFWSDSIDVGGADITAGHLSLDDTTGDDDTCANAAWTLDTDEEVEGVAFDPDLDKLVPGDDLTKICTFEVNAVGEHLRATLGTTGGEESGDLAAETSTSAVFTVGGDTVTEITEGNDGQELEATITVTFDGDGATNDSQDDELNISAYTVTATQVHD